MTDEQCGAIKNDGEPCEYAASYEDGKCGIHSKHNDGPGPGPGRDSTFEDHRDELLEAAREPIKTRDVARTAGVGKTALYDWLDEHESFADKFTRARSEAARELVERGLEDDDVDTRMIQFLLERTFDYTKTQELEHSGEGLTINIPDGATDF